MPLDVRNLTCFDCLMRRCNERSFLGEIFMRVCPPLSCGLFAMSRLAYLVLAIVLAALPQSVSAQRGERWVASWVASPHGPYPVGNPSAQPDQKFAFPVPESGA